MQTNPSKSLLLLVGLTGSIVLFLFQWTKKIGAIESGAPEKIIQNTIERRTQTPVTDLPKGLNAPSASAPQTTRLLSDGLKAHIADGEAEIAKMAKMLDGFFPSSKIQEGIWAKRQPEYRALLVSWGLTPSQIDSVEDVVHKRDLKVAALRVKYLSLGASSAEGKKAISDLRNIEVESRGELEKLIGRDLESQLTLWENSRGERQHLSNLAHSFENQGMKLSAEQEQALLNAMYNARTSLNRGRATRIERLGPELTLEVLRQTQGLLDKNQETILKDYLNSIVRN